MPLEDHYSGDEAFTRFASVPNPALDEEIAGWSRWLELVNLCAGEVLLARALFMVVGTRALEWMDERPPIMEGMSGRECLVSVSGLARLKEAILRFP